jgi:competence protein ComEC
VLQQTRIPSQQQLAARHRAMLSAAAFASGVVLAVYAPGVSASAWFGFGCVAAAAAVVTSGTPAKVALLVAVALVGAGLSTRSLGPLPADSLAHDLPGAAQKPVLVELEGLAIEPPKKYKPPTGALSEFVPTFMRQGESYRFALSVRRVKQVDEWRSASGELTVWINTESELLAAATKGGSFVRIIGQARGNRGPANPGDIDWTLANRDRHRVGAVWTSPDLVTKAKPTSTRERAESFLVGLRSNVQSRAAGIIERAIEDDARAGPVVRGLLLGARGSDDEDVTGAFRRVGLIHLLAVSGFHVAVAAGLALLAIRLTGDRGWLEPMVVCLAMGLYVMIVPMRAPIFRAALLVLVVLATDAIGRRHDRISVVSWLAIVWLVIRPSDLFSIGFQLSFGVTWWLMLLSEPTSQQSPSLDTPTRIDVLKWIVTRPIHTSAACWSVAMPAVIYHIGIVSPLAVIATVITVPMIIVTMWLGFVVLVLGVAVPALAPAASIALKVVSGAAAETALWFDSLAVATVSLQQVSIAWTVAATLGVIWFWRRATLRDKKWVALLLVLLAWFGAEQQVARRTLNSGTQIHMLDVGNASAVVIRSGGKALLWDCGSWRDDIGKKLIPNACSALGSPAVETIVVTHANIDHFMGVIDAAEVLGVKRVVTGESFRDAAMRDPDGAPAHVLIELQRLGVEHVVAVRGDEITIGDNVLRVIHPPAGFVPRAENDSSLVAILEPAGTGVRVMLTGDIQQEAMAILLESGDDLQADVLELPHHGSAHEAAYAFTQQIDPKVVLQSTGIQRLDDPRWDHVRSGRAWYTTERAGCASVFIDADGRITARSYR